MASARLLEVVAHRIQGAPATSLGTPSCTKRELLRMLHVNASLLRALL